MGGTKTTRDPDGCFERLKRSFNYRTYGSRCAVLADCILEAISRRPAPVTVLDVGCGAGLEGNGSLQEQLARRADRFWAVEPDASAQVRLSLFDRCWRTTLEQADLAAESVDVAYACMVLEHLTRPAGFMRRLFRALKGGGQFLALTINGRSYLGRTARLAHRLGVQERLLYLLHGKRRVEAYHHPAVYACNDEQRIAKLARETGFARAEFAYLENGEATNYYWPGPLRWIGGAIDYKHKLFRQRGRFNNLLVLLTK